MRRILLLAFVIYGLTLKGQHIEGNKIGIGVYVEHEVFKKEAFEISREYTDPHNLVSHIYGFQTHKGKKIEGALFAVHIKEQEVVSFTHSFIPLELAHNTAEHELSHQEAAAIFLNRHGVYVPSGFANTESIGWKVIDQNHYQLTGAYISDQAIDMEKTYFLHEGSLVPSWSISGFISSKNNAYYTVIHAKDGSLLDELNQTLRCTDQCSHESGHYHPREESDSTEQEVPHNKKGKTASYRVFAFPVESPNHGETSLVQNVEGSASPYGWHDVNGIKGADYSITRGNNVYASDDIGATNEPGYSPKADTNLSFDFPFKPEGAPKANLDAAVTNLFYANNVLHDVLYEYGFTEQSGNFQLNNYHQSPDGSGDPMLAEAQDGSSFNNATFSFASDGKSPRIQMFLWTTAGHVDVLAYSNEKEFTTHNSRIAKFGPRIELVPVEGKLVLVQDSGAATHTACSIIANKEALEGNIALIERSNCEFTKQIKRAQNAGAIAAIVYSDERYIVTMQGNGSGENVKIPSVMVNGYVGQQLLDRLKEQEELRVVLKETERTQYYDSDFDNGVIAHEYGHGLSHRLTGGPGTGGCLENAEQMGEGWSDFLAIFMTHRPEHTALTPRSVGSYVKNQQLDDGGMRPYPYTTDTLISPYRFGQVATMYAPHGTGAIWCAMLWDLYWALIDVYGYDPDIYKGTGGNNLCMQLVVDGLKLQPCNPGFIDGRDAILLADQLNNDGANERLIWEAFARRGLGWSARGGNPDSRTDQIEAFDIPRKFLGYVDIKKTAEPGVYEMAPLVYTIDIENASSDDYLNVVVTDTIPNSLQLDPSSLNCDWKVNGQVLTLEIDTLAAGQTISCSYTTRAPKGAYTLSSVQGGGETLEEPWTTERHSGIGTWVRQHETKAEGIWAWYVNNLTTYCNQSLYFEMGTIGENDKTLSFAHQLATKYGKNGGVVELSTDRNNWVDAQPYFEKNGYNSIVKNGGTNTLDGRAAFSGYSEHFKYTQIDVSSYQGEELWVRFRFISSVSATEQSWYIDDLKVGTYAGVLNTAHAQVNNKQSQSSVYTEILDIDDHHEEPRDSMIIPERGDWLYPNPTNQTLFIRLDNVPTQASLSITTSKGKHVLSLELIEDLNEVDLSTLSAGVYIITLHEPGNTRRTKLIKS